MRSNRHTLPDLASASNAGRPVDLTDTLFGTFATPAPLVYDGAPPCHRDGPETERLAAASVETWANELRVMLLAEIRARPGVGVTVKEGVRLLLASDKCRKGDDVGSIRNTIGPRLTELKLAGLVYNDPAVRREKCAAYIATDADGDGRWCRPTGRKSNPR